MKTIIQDGELEFELQELYILSKHWISDIHFIEDELRFLKHVVEKHLAPSLKTEQLFEADDFNAVFAQTERNIPAVKTGVSDFLNFISPLVKEPDTVIGLNLLEKFTALDTEMKTLFESLKQVKKLLFSFTEEVIKTEKCTVFLNRS
jgi:hypothetical protein